MPAVSRPGPSPLPADFAAFGTMAVAFAAMALGVGGCSSAAPEAPGSPPLPAEAHTSLAVEVIPVATGLEHPWGMAFLPGNEGILVTERPGRLRRIGPDGSVSEPLAGVPSVVAQGQGGLLDVALPPSFPETRFVYLTLAHADPDPGSERVTTALARGRLEGGGLVDTELLFVADAWAPGGRHLGSRIVFDGRGHLYLSVGDRGQDARAADPGDHAGTTVRLREDGSIPPDNPFVGVEGVAPEVYSFGHRNAQGMVVHPVTGAIWQHEHGPRGGDEINRIRPGRDYGWPRVSFGRQYDFRGIPNPEPGDGFELPVLHWSPSIAPSGMAFYDGDAFPEWQGDLFVGALAGRHLQRIRLDGETPVAWERLLEDRGERIRDVRSGPDGFLYLLVDASEGSLLRLEPAGDRVAP
jgi:aldose sugar dehydrogenase